MSIHPDTLARVETGNLLRALHAQYLDVYADALAEGRSPEAGDMTSFRDFIEMEITEAGL